jgi:exonuclease III
METLRIITWNCRVGGFRHKSAHVEPLRPDVLAVQEVEPIDNVLIFGGVQQPTFWNQIKDPANPRRSIGLFSYTNAKIRAEDGADPQYSFRRFVVNKGFLEFNVAAVWTWATKAKATTYMQAHDGVARHREWIRERATVILGDLNMDASYRNSSLPALIKVTSELGLVSAYHTFFGEQFGHETRDTYFHRGNTTAAFHLDYCFVPASWSPFIRQVIVGDHSAWAKVSDHVPLIVDLAIPPTDNSSQVSLPI